MTRESVGAHESVGASRPMRVVVIEDQPVARQHLLDLVGSMEGLVCVGEASDGIAALQLIAEERPDVAFLDIEMPGLSGIEVLRRAEPQPLVIFTTAWDHHAVTAFELQALDYVLKPFGRDRIEAAVARARETLQLTVPLDEPGPAPDDQLARAESALAPDSGDAPLTRVFVHARGRIFPVDLASVEHIEAHGDYVLLHTSGASHLLRIPLKHLLARLDPDHFIRIHRSHIINLTLIASLTPHPDGRLEVELKSGRQVASSRTRAPELRKRLR